MTSPKPFLKWVGGKSDLAPTILKHFPTTYGQYFEPFLGGGGMYFSHCAPNPILGDHNEYLIETWRNIRDRWEDVARCLDTMPNTKDDYYRIRDKFTRLDGVGFKASIYDEDFVCVEQVER